MNQHIPSRSFKFKMGFMIPGVPRKAIAASKRMVSVSDASIKATDVLDFGAHDQIEGVFSDGKFSSSTALERKLATPPGSLLFLDLASAFEVIRMFVSMPC